MRDIHLVMHVAILADFAEPSGGAPAVAIASAIALRRRGVPVTYLQGIRGAPDPRLEAAGVSRLDLGLLDIWDRPAGAALADGIWNRRAASRLGAALAGLPGRTVLHLHQWTRSLSPSVFPVLLGSGHPLVVTLHDYFAACPNGVYYRFDRGEPCRLVPLSLPCVAAPCDPRSMAHKGVRVLRTAATRAAIRRGGFDVIHVSDRGQATVEPFLPGGVRHHRIDNPVEVEKALPARIGPEAAVAFVGRLTREKGADLVAEAAQAAGVPALFVGEGPAEPDIRRLNPTAEILGWRSRGEVDAVLRSRVRAVVAPSRWYETGPLTIYEALAAGLPAVASARSGAAEKVRHGETGFVTEPTVPALAAAFASLGTTEAARRMGAYAFAHYWAAPLSPERHADALLRLYDDVLARAANLPRA